MASAKPIETSRSGNLRKRACVCVCDIVFELNSEEGWKDESDNKNKYNKI